MKSEPKEDHPVLVFEETMLSGQVRQFGKAEPSIWTESMLIALGNGVQGGKWYSLGDKSFSVKALDAAFTRVKANAGSPGVDGWTVERFDSDRQGQLARMHEALMEGSYSPKPVRRVWIPKPGSKEKRPLGIPTVRDRVVQTSLRATLEPIFEREFRDSSYGFRPGRSCKQALHKVWLALKAGKRYVVDADLKGFFDTIPHEVILSGLKQKITDGKILGLVSAYLTQGVMSEGLPSPDEEEVGTPQGSPLSPLLANIALHGLDVLVEDSGFEIVRYADDFVILCETMGNAEAALEAVRDWTVRHGLELHSGKTRIVDYGSGKSFEFLGFEFRKDRVFPRKKSIKKLRDNIRSRTPRLSGKSMHAVIANLNPVLRGWFHYFKESPEHVFRGADEFVRRRLRAMLAKRNRKRLYHPGLSASKLWPKAYFAECGLYSMQKAHKDRSILLKAKH
jgi:RNA-directed DNA polymerase